ncbi:MAG: serine--tRNA ligase [Oscillospiraceae bacterium]|nr:serine--tRNA ligase [Oscillospiraceae bacterium]
MLDIKFVRQNPDAVKENIKRKFQDDKLELVDNVIALDEQYRAALQQAENLRAARNKGSKEIGGLMAQKKLDEANAKKAEIAAMGTELDKLAALEKELGEKVREIMLVLPQMMDDSVPTGKDDSENVELVRYGEAKVPDFDVPYHVEIMEALHGIDLDSARKTSGNGFYFLMGDVARLHSAVLSYARDFMINKGFTYCIPPYMIRSSVVQGVMSFADVQDMVYKIEGEDLYLIGTSEHSMIGRYIDSLSAKESLPQLLTGYSPCFRKEVGAHGIEERGVFRVHQFEKQEMIVVCEPEDSAAWFDKILGYTVEFFQSLEMTVRTLACCSGDLGDLKVKQVEVEAWSPRQQKYFEVGSCSNLGDAQARRLGIRVRGHSEATEPDRRSNYYAHTLNNTVVTPPRMLIAFLENHLREDGTVHVPEVLRPYMGNAECLVLNA